MKNIFFKIVSVVFFTTLTISTLNAKILINKKIINDRASIKIDEIGEEVYQKTKINIYLIAVKNLGGKSIREYANEKVKSLKKPFVLLILAKEDKQVEIVSSPEAKDKFDKEEVLDPMSGTIIPILVTKVKKEIKIDDKYSAAMLNGYSDIAEQIADSYNIKLVSGIGSTNRNIINAIRLFVYGSVLLVILMFLKRRFSGKKE